MVKLNYIIRDTMMRKPSDKWPTYDGAMLKRYEYVTASEASKCIRELAFTKNKEADTVPVADFWDTISTEEYNRHLKNFVASKRPDGIYARGHNIEAWAVEIIREGLVPEEGFLFAGKEQRSFHDPKSRVSGTPDGVFVNYEDGVMWLTEFKSTGVMVTQPRYSHISQVNVNIGLIEHLIRKHGVQNVLGYADLPETFEGGTLLYVAADDYLNMQEFPVEHDGGQGYIRATNKAAALFKDGELQKPEDLPPQGLEHNGCFFCEYKAACKLIEEQKRHAGTTAKLRGIIDKEMNKTVPTMPKFKSDEAQHKVVQLLVSYANWADEEKVAKKHKDALKVAIEDWIKAQKDMKAEFESDGNEVKVSWTVAKRSGSIIREKVVELVKSVGKDMKDYIGPDTETNTLRVSVKRVG